MEKGTDDLAYCNRFRHAAVACKVLSARAYEKSSWHYQSQKTFAASGACPKSFATKEDLTATGLCPPVGLQGFVMRTMQGGSGEE